MKKLLIYVMIIAILLFSFSSCDFGSPASTDKKNPSQKNTSKATQTVLPTKNNSKIKIGIACSIGDANGTEGQTVKNVVELAIDEINAAGGLDGIKFEALVFDSNNYVTEKDLYEDLVDEGMQIFLGSTDRESAVVFSELAEEDNIFVLSSGTFGGELDAFDTTYQMSGSAIEQGKEAAEFFNENYVGKKIGVFYRADEDHSSKIYKGFSEALDPYFSVVTADFTDEDFIYESQVQLLKNCDVIFMPVEYDSAWIFMSQMKNVYNEVATYVGCDSFEMINDVENFDSFAIEQEIIFLSYFDSNATDGPVADFFEKYSTEYDEEKETPRTLAASVYDSVYALFEALRMAKFNGKEISPNMSASNLCTILEGIFESSYFEFRGITGACEGDERSQIIWVDRKAQKEAVTVVVKARSD